MQYYLMLEGVIYGPYTLQEMQSFKLVPDTPVHLSSWSEDEWVNASELPELSKPKEKKENAMDDNFCGECGSKKPESSGWNCPNCGKQDVKSKFCPACGTKKPESNNILTPEQMKAHVTPDREQEKKRREVAEKLRTGASIPITTTTTEEFEPLPYLLLYSMCKGQIIKFGKYAGEELVWSVLDVDISNNTALLINACGLEKMLFNAYFTNWSDSEIRKWLNEIYNALTPSERAKIVPRPSGDKVFLLSKEEVEYFSSDYIYKNYDFKEHRPAILVKFELGIF